MGRKLLTMKITVLFLFLIFSGCINQEKTSNNSQNNGLEMLYDVYPDTDDAPVLELFWGPPELQLDQIDRVTPYGVWEGPPGVWEPAVEIQFYTKNTSHDPVYAACEGTLVFISEEWNSLYVRYGRNYGIIYHHIVDFSNTLELGMKIERETLLGYTETKNNLGWWEIELDVKRGDIFRTVPTFDYFSKESQGKLMAILNASWWDESSGSTKSWTVTDGDTWTVYLDEPEWWAAPDHLGYIETEESETIEDFVEAHNISWILENYR